jgi:hypothetical protein
MSYPSAKIKLQSKRMENKMSKSAIETLDEALEILKAKNPITAYAGMVGYLMAFATKETADRILTLVKESK